MHNFVVNKRIDNLGRIVIPKEFRRKLKIIDGENLELSINDKEIIVRKTSFSDLDKKLINIILEFMKEHLDEETIIFDITGNCYSNNPEEMNINFLEEFVNGTLKESTLNNRSIFPIYVDSNLYGGIILNSELKDENKIKILGMLKKIIEKYLEA